MVPADDGDYLSDLVRLSVPGFFLEVDELGHAGPGEDPVAALPSDLSEAEGEQ
jgi:hypothetical protein